MAVAYAKERFTFGRAIGSYQAIKHGLTEVLRLLENARSLLYYAGYTFADRPAEFPLAASAARSAAGPRARLRRPPEHHDPRRDRGDVGARRAAVLPPRAAVAAAARRDVATRPTASRASCSPRPTRPEAAGQPLSPPRPRAAGDRQEDRARDVAAAGRERLRRGPGHDRAPAAEHAAHRRRRDLLGRLADEPGHERLDARRSPRPRRTRSAPGPGASTCTTRRVPASSACSASEKDCTNAFVAAYVAMPGTGWKAASEATLRIAPARRSTIGAQERERQLVHARRR